MKKLTAIILALMLMLTLTVTAAAESDGLEPAQRHIYQLVTEHDPEPVFHGNFTYWRWEQTIENPADNVVDWEIWLGFYGPTERLSGGTIDVLTETDELATRLFEKFSVNCGNCPATVYCIARYEEQPQTGDINCLDAFAYWLKQETNVRKGNDNA